MTDAEVLCERTNRILDELKRVIVRLERMHQRSLYCGGRDVAQAIDHYETAALEVRRAWSSFMSVRR